MMTPRKDDPPGGPPRERRTAAQRVIGAGSVATASVAIGMLFGAFASLIGYRFVRASEFDRLADRVTVVEAKLDTVGQALSGFKTQQEATGRNVASLVTLRCMEITERDAALARLPCDSILGPVLTQLRRR